MERQGKRTLAVCPTCGGSREVTIRRAWEIAYEGARCRACATRGRPIPPGLGKYRQPDPLVRSLIHTPFHAVWAAMKQRCTNPKHKLWMRYGGRGISVCSRWYDFANFVEDMYPNYERGLSLDRIDNDGNYSAANCRWATSVQQARNMSTNVLVTHDGNTQTVAEWSLQTGLSREVIQWRLRNGWGEERALTQPT